MLLFLLIAVAVVVVVVVVAVAAAAIAADAWTRGIEPPMRKGRRRRWPRKKLKMRGTDRQLAPAVAVVVDPWKRRKRRVSRP